MAQVYEVGDSVRDSLLGIPNKDEDFIFVLDSDESNLYKSINSGFKFMKNWIIKNNYQIFLETKKCLTIRAKSPQGKIHNYVLARKELGYKPNTREPIVVPGNLQDDLLRRDFTINAMARPVDCYDELIDPFDGYIDLRNGVLRTPLNPMVTFTDDPLRVLRAVRFCIKLDFEFHQDIWEAVWNSRLPDLMKVVSTDCIREELHKCFKYDTVKTIKVLNELPIGLVESWLGREGLWLMPTTRK